MVYAQIACNLMRADTVRRTHFANDLHIGILAWNRG